MHRFNQRLMACEASGWEPLKRRLVVKTSIIHLPACALNHRGAFCDCAGQILVTLSDGRRFEIDAEGKPVELARRSMPG